MITSESWLQAFADCLGVDALSAQDVSSILELAGSAAHASQRIAAPVACWLAARAGLTPTEALEVARGVIVEDS